MSSPEVESFTITEDDLADELNPSRRKIRMSKHQATYGMWADEEDEGTGRARFSSGRGGKKDYTAPVSFVSGGVKVGDKVTKEEDEDDRSSESDDEDDKIRAEIALKVRRKATSMKGPNINKGEFGDWERHTKGIGQKLLEKMGHVAGRGLGKNLQGISKPVEAVKRKGRGAVGMYGTEKSEQAERDFPTKPDSDEEEEKEFRVKLAQWKKGEGEKRKKTRYMTAEQLIAKGGSAGTEARKKVRECQSELSKVKVIDMTGKEQRILSGYHALSLKHDQPDDSDIGRTQDKKQFDLPELLHNLDLLVGMSEDEILQNDKKQNYEQNLVVNLESEHDRMVSFCDQEKRQIERLNEVMMIVNECEQRCKGVRDRDSIERCAELFRKLQEEYYEEYKLYELSSLAVAMVYPLMKSEFEGWDPLRNPHQCTLTLSQWKELLQRTSNTQPYNQGFGYQSGGGAGMGPLNPYDSLVWNVVLPHIRIAIMKVWRVRDSDSLLAFLETWKLLLPDWIMTNIMDQLIFPKLSTEVENWNPLSDTVPIHAWLHPWLPLMGDRLEPLYGPIRQKLANALTNWHPSDPSAKLILQPWVGVFKQAHMDAFVIRSILPKLSLCIQELQINPQQQQLDAWNWVMSWVDIIPSVHVSSMLDKSFFPRWLNVLSTWLSSSPNYDEITNWYIGWKSMIPEALLGDPTVKERLHKALELMNRAVAGNRHQPGARENVAYLTSNERRGEFESSRREVGEPARGLTAAGAIPTSFKDLIEMKAEENNLVFVPSGKTHEARMVYRFGKVQMYLDRDIIFVNEAGRWKPVSLNTLIQLAR